MAELIEKREFNQGINADDSLTKLEPGEYLNGFNFRGGTSEYGRVSGLQPIPSTLQLLDVPPGDVPFPSDFTNIGGCVDEERQRILFFNCAGPGSHSYIGCWDILNRVGYTVLSSTTVEGSIGWEKTNYIHSAFVVNGILYWTDNIGPRRINIDAGIKLNHPGYATTVQPYTNPVSQAVLAWIRRQPGLPPTFIKLTQTAPVVEGNQIQLEALQFCYRYQYRDYEISTLSGLSVLAPENADGETYNAIDVFIPDGEFIDQDVIQVDLVAVYLSSGNYFIINSWKRSIPADAAAIADHNAGTAQLKYRFYNDRAGIALDSAYTVKIADSVPITAQTVERAKNRAFMAGIKAGYDAPSLTSLLVSTIQQDFPPGGSGPIVGEWYILRIAVASGPLHAGFHSIYVLQTTTAVGPQPPGPIYIYQYSGTVPGYPPSVNESDLTFLGSSTNAAAHALNPGGITTVFSYTDQSAASIVNTGFTPVSAVVGKAFKTRSAYQLSISFKDNYGRETPIVTNQSLTIQIPNTGFSIHRYVTGLFWQLSNANALNEIPEEAYYYSINISKCLLTRFFLQGLGACIYADKDSDGEYTFVDSTYDSDRAGVAIDTSFLLTHGQGYVFSEGDVVSLYVNGAYHTLSIIAQVGKFIVCELANVGGLSAQDALYEIYTPYKRQTDEPHYEVSQIFPVLNPGAPSRLYSTMSGIINGDVFLFGRTNSVQHYIVEAMNINDKFYRIWNTDAGRPNFLSDIGQVTDPHAVIFSNPLLQGGRVNGLSTFDSLDRVELPLELGPISKLILTSKIQKEGTVMLAICRSQTVSLYLGEVQVAAPQGNAFLATDTNVIGTIYPLKGSFGTTNPESVQQYRGMVFYFDAYNGVVVQYSDNGLEPISRFKTRSFWRRWAAKYMSLTQQQMFDLGGTSFVVGGIDPFNGEYLLSIPQVEAANPAGELPGDISGDPQNLFNVYDGMAKTMCFKIEQNRWLPAYSFWSESIIYAADLVFGFKAGRLSQFNDGSTGFNNFFGKPYQSLIMFTANILPNSPKQPKAINVETDHAPGACVLLVEYPNQQITDIQPDEWNQKEGIFYSTVRMNRIDPTFTDPDEALNFGERLLSKAVLIQIGFTPEKLFNLKYVNVLHQVLGGHQTIATQ